MDAVTTLTVAIALVIGLAVAIVAVGWLMSIATGANARAARWVFFCEGK